jgi:hypothetical protein
VKSAQWITEVCKEMDFLRRAARTSRIFKVRYEVIRKK